MSNMAVPQKRSTVDLLGLNQPRGLLDFGPISPPAGTGAETLSSPTYHQMNYDDSKYNSSPPFAMNYNNSPITPPMNLQRNVSLGSIGTPLNSPMTPPGFQQGGRPLRYSSLSDSCSSASPTFLDSSFLLSTGSRPPTPERDSFHSNGTEANLADAMNNLTLNDTLGASLQGLDWQTLQNLQQLQALRYLQAAGGLQNQNLLNSLAPISSIQHILDKWNNVLPTAPTSPLNLLPPPINGAGGVASNDALLLERAVRSLRSSASLHDTTITWGGVLPTRLTTRNPSKSSSSRDDAYSTKVFLGGVPWDITESMLVESFKRFGHLVVDWPGKNKNAVQPKGFAYIVFETEMSVRSLLQNCTHDPNGNYYFKLSSKRIRAKDVQVIPWLLGESNYSKSSFQQKLDASKSVFVGALHGMMNAEALANVMNDLFGGVIYAGIDTDKFKYPIGSGRVTFNNSHSYIRAVAAGFVEVKTAKFSKKLQVDPYLEDSLCSLCNVQQGPYFCRELTCFRYFCRVCWQWQHQHDKSTHRPMMRTSKQQSNDPELQQPQQNNDVAFSLYRAAFAANRSGI